MAIELATIAEGKLKDGRLRDILPGQEDDIRQDAIIMALGWYANHLEKSAQNKLEDPWNSSHKMAIALHFIKLRYLRQCSNSPKTVSMEHLDENIPDPNWEFRPYVWRSDQMRVAMENGLNMAVQSGLLSHANRIVGRLVILHEVSVSDAAEHLKITRSAIYQHLNRIKKVIRPLIDKIEIPFI